MMPYLRRALLRFAVSSMALSGAAAGAVGAGRAFGPEVPERITPAWVVRNFPGCIDLPCGPHSDFWLPFLLHRVSGRADFEAAVITVAHDTRVDEFTRARAALLLARIGTPRALDALARAITSTRPGDLVRQGALSSLGYGRPRALPRSVYAALRAVMADASPEGARDRWSAVGALGWFRTEEARRILIEHRESEPDPYVRESIEHILRDWQPR